MNKHKLFHAFTILELLIVIVVIGIIATITVISYNSFISQTKISSIKSDLSVNGRKLQLYYTQYGSFPTNLNANNCPAAPIVDNNYCIKLSGGNLISSYTGTVSDYILVISNGPDAYKITNSTPPVAVNVPASPIINSITPGLNQLSVNFTAGDNGGSTIINYEYSTNGGAVWTTRAPSSTASPIVISGLAGFVSYNVLIRAINSNGAGAPSNSVSATVNSVPAAPTISTINPDFGQVRVNFSAGDNGGSTITNYEYSTNGGTNWNTRSPASTSSPLIIGGLSGNVSYNIQIRAVNNSGSGAQSNQVASVALANEAPNCTWGGYVNPVSTFTITNLLSTSLGAYNFAPTTGTISFNQSSGVFTVTTSSEFEVTVTPVSLSMTYGPSKIVGRKNITYYTYQTGGGCNSAVPCGMDGCDCTLAQWCCSYYDPVYTVTAENSPPAYYQKIGSNWVRL